MARQIFDINTLFGETSNQDIVSDEMAIINMITNTLLIPTRSRKWRPTFGSSQQNFLNRPVNAANAESLRLSTYQSLNTWVPYAVITLNDIQLELNATRTGYLMDVAYKSKLSGYSGNVGFELFANTGT